VSATWRWPVSQKSSTHSPRLVAAATSARSIASVLKNLHAAVPAGRAEAVLDAKTNADACLGARHGGARDNATHSGQAGNPPAPSVDLACDAHPALLWLLIRHDRRPLAGTGQVPTARRREDDRFAAQSSNALPGKNGSRSDP